MRTKNRILGAAVAIAAGVAAWALGQSRAAADDARLTVTPAVQRVSESDNSDNSGASVQLVQWGRPYGYRYRGYYGPYYGRRYYAPYYTPYYTPYYYYGYPSYGGYGYTYSAYPAYGYPVYGYRGYGVGVGIW